MGMTRDLQRMALIVAGLALMSFLPSAQAASAAGAGIELDGKYVGGYTTTWKKESRAELLRKLPRHYLFLERTFKVPVDPKNPDRATLNGKIRLMTKIRGDREVMAETKVLHLVRMKGRWYVDEKSLDRALKPAGKK